MTDGPASPPPALSIEEFTLPTAFLMLLAAGLVTGARAPRLVSLSPDVIPAGAPNSVVKLGVRGATGPFAVRLSDCRGRSVTVPVADYRRPTLSVPAELITRPCVLRVRITSGTGELPLAVADSALFTLPVPTPDPNEYHVWRGDFNTSCEADTTPASPTQSLVAIWSDSALHRSFVLGKNGHAVMRVPTLAPHVAPATGSCVYVVLAGVAPDDVRWGPQDVEAFWLATLDPGEGIDDLQYLADMVVEPSGPPDRH